MSHEWYIAPLLGYIAQINNIGLSVLACQTIGCLQREEVTCAAKDRIELCHIHRALYICLQMSLACAEDLVLGVLQMVIARQVITRLVPSAVLGCEGRRLPLAVAEHHALPALLAYVAAKTDYSRGVSRRGDSIGKYEQTMMHS